MQFDEKTFVSRLKKITKDRGTQKELADKLEVDERYISLWCKGVNTPSLSNLYALSNALHVSSDYLLGLTDDVSSKDEQSCSVYTGLSSESIRVLHESKDINYVNNEGKQYPFTEGLSRMLLDDNEGNVEFMSTGMAFLMYLTQYMVNEYRGNKVIELEGYEKDGKSKTLKVPCKLAKSYFMDEIRHIIEETQE